MTDSSELLHRIFLGEVASVQVYGAFIRIPGTKTQGLVHKSQISSSVVDDANDVLKKGERVWCKAISINDDGKVSLSMKVVDQGSGSDLDPAGVQVHLDEQRRRQRPPSGGRKKIELQAVLNTTCSKCGTRGHLAKDCFKDPSGKVYELLPDDEPLDNLEQQQTLLKELLKKEKDGRKKLKKHKKKKRKSSSSSSEEEVKKKKKKRKKSRSRSPRERSKKRK